jgi:hypothetical protein
MWLRDHVLEPISFIAAPSVLGSKEARTIVTREDSDISFAEKIRKGLPHQKTPSNSLCGFLFRENDRSAVKKHTNNTRRSISAHPRAAVT